MVEWWVCLGIGVIGYCLGAAHVHHRNVQILDRAIEISQRDKERR